MRPLPRGGFVAGLVAGLLIGLGVALAVALYITNTPVPFVDKLPQRTPEQDAAEAQRNRDWNPNAALSGKPAPRAPAASGAAAPAASGAIAPAASAVAPEPAPRGEAALPPVPASGAARVARDPGAILSGQAMPGGFDYWVQIGAYARADEAEAQRARLGLLGQQARVLEREQAGRTVYRVRIGPFEARDEAEGLQAKLTAAGFESNLVRVER